MARWTSYTVGVLGWATAMGLFSFATASVSSTQSKILHDLSSSNLEARLLSIDEFLAKKIQSLENELKSFKGAGDKTAMDGHCADIEKLSIDLQTELNQIKASHEQEVKRLNGEIKTLKLENESLRSGKVADAKTLEKLNQELVELRKKHEEVVGEYEEKARHASSEAQRQSDQAKEVMARSEREKSAAEAYSKKLATEVTNLKADILHQKLRLDLQNSKVEELGKSIQENTVEITRLEQEKRTKDQQINTHELKLKEATEDLSLKNDQVLAQQQEIIELRAELKALKEAHEQQKQMADEHSKLLVGTKNCNLQLMTENQKLTSNLESMIKEKHALQAEADQLTLTNQGLAEKNESMKVQISGLQASLAHLTEANEQMAEDGKALKAENAKLSKKEQDLRQDLDALTRKSEVAAKVAGESSQKLSELEQECSNLKDKLVIEAKEKASLTSKLQTSETESADRVGGLERQLRQLQLEKTQVIRELEKTVKAKAGLEKTNAEAKKIHEEALSDMIRKHSGELSKLKDLLRQQEGTISAHVTKIKEQDAGIIDSAKERTDLKEQVSRYEAANGSIKADMQKVQNELVAKTLQLEALKSEHQKIEVELKKANLESTDKVKKLERKLQEQEEATAKLASSNESQQVKISEAARQLQECKATINTLSEELAAAKKEVVELTTSLDEKQRLVDANMVKCLKLEGEMKNAKIELEHQTSINRHLGETINQYKSQEKTAESCNIDLQNQVNKLSDEIKRQADEINILRKENNEVDTKVKELLNEKFRLEGDLEDKTTKVSTLEQSLAESERKVKQLEEEIARLRREHGLQLDKNASLKKDFEGKLTVIVTEREKLQDQVSALIRENTDVKVTAENLQTRLSDVEARSKESLRMETEKLQTAIKAQNEQYERQLEEQDKAHKEAIEDYRIQLKSLHKDLEQIRTERDNLADENRSLKDNVQKESSNILSIEKNLRAKEVELAARAAAGVEMEEKFKALLQTNELARTDIAGREKEIRSLKAQISELEEKVSEIDRLKKDQLHFKSLNTAQREKIDQLEKLVEELKASKIAADKSLARAAQANNQLLRKYSTEAKRHEHYLNRRASCNLKQRGYILELQREIQDLHEKHNETLQNISDLHSTELVGLFENKKLLSLELHALRNNESTLNSHVQKLKIALQDQSKEFSKHTAILKQEFDGVISSFNDKILKLEDALLVLRAKHQTELAAAQQTIEEKEQNLNLAQATLGAAKNSLHLEKGRTEELMKDKLRLSEDLKDVTLQKEELSFKASNLEGQLGIKQKELQDGVEMISDLRAQKERLEGQLKMLEPRIQVFSDENAALRVERDAFEKQVFTLESETFGLKDKLELLQSEIKGLLANSSNNSEAQTAIITQLETENKQLQMEKDEHMQMAGALERTGLEQKSKLDQQAAKIEQLKKDLEATETTSRKQKTEIEELTNMRQQLDAEILNLKAKYEKLERVSKQALGLKDSAVGKLQGKLNLLEKQLEEKTTKIEEANQEIQSYNLDIQSLKLELKASKETAKINAEEQDLQIKVLKNESAKSIEELNDSFQKIALEKQSLIDDKSKLSLENDSLLKGLKKLKSENEVKSKDNESLLKRLSEEQQNALVLGTKLKMALEENSSLQSALEETGNCGLHQKERLEKINYEFEKLSIQFSKITTEKNLLDGKTAQQAEQIKSLEATLHENLTRIAELDRENTTLAGKLEQQVLEIARISKSHKATEEEFENAKVASAERAKSLELNNENLKSSLERQTASNQRLEQELKEKIKDQEGLIAELKVKLQGAEKERQHLKNSNIENSQKIENIEKLKAELTDRVSRAELEALALRQSNDEKSKEQEKERLRHQETVDGCRDEKRQMETQIMDLNVKMKQTSAVFKLVLRRKQLDIKRLHNEIDEHLAQMRKLESQVEQVQEQSTQGEACMQDQTKRIGEQMTEIHQLKEQLNQYNELISERDDEIVELKSKLSTASLDLEKFKELSKNAETRVAQTIESSVKTKADSDVEIERLKASLKNLEAESDLRHNRIEQLAAELAMATENAKTLQNEKQGLEQIKDEQLMQIKKLEDDLRVLTLSKGEFERKFDYQLVRGNDLVGKLNALEAKLEFQEQQARMSSNEFAEQKQTYDRHLKDLEAINREKDGELNALRNSYTSLLDASERQQKEWKVALENKEIELQTQKLMLTKSREEITGFQERIREIENESANGKQGLEAIMARGATEIEQLTTKLNAAVEENAKLVLSLKKVVEESALRDIELVSLRADKAKLQKNLEDATDKNHLLTEKLSGATTSIKLKTRQIVTLFFMLSQHQIRVRKLEGDLKIEHERNQILNRKNIDLEANEDMLRGNIKDQGAKINELGIERQSLTDNLTKLEALLRAKEEQNAALDRTLSGKAKELEERLTELAAARSQIEVLQVENLDKASKISEMGQKIELVAISAQESKEIIQRNETEIGSLKKSLEDAMNMSVDNENCNARQAEVIQDLTLAKGKLEGELREKNSTVQALKEKAEEDGKILGLTKARIAELEKTLTQNQEDHMVLLAEERKKLQLTEVAKGFEIQQLENELTQQLAQVKEKSQENASLKSENDRLKTDLAAQLNYSKEFEESTKRLQEINKVKDELISRHERATQECRQEKESQGIELETLKVNISALTVDAQSMQEKILNQDNKIIALEAEKLQLEFQNQTLVSRVKNLEDENEHVIASKRENDFANQLRINELLTENSRIILREQELKEMNETTSGLYTQCQETITLLRRDSTRLTAGFEELSEKLANAQNEKLALEEERRTEHHSNVICKNEIEQLKDQVSSVQAKFDYLTKNFQEFQQGASIGVEEDERIAGQVVGILHQNAKLAHEVKTLEAHLEQLSEKNTSQILEYKKMAAAFYKEEGLLKLAKSQISEKDGIIASLRNKLTESEGRIGVLNRDLTEALLLWSSLQEENRNLQGKLQELKKNAEDKEQLSALNEKTIQDLQSRNERTISELQRLQKLLDEKNVLLQEKDEVTRDYEAFMRQVSAKLRAALAIEAPERIESLSGLGILLDKLIDGNKKANQSINDLGLLLDQSQAREAQLIAALDDRAKGLILYQEKDEQCLNQIRDLQKKNYHLERVIERLEKTALQKLNAESGLVTTASHRRSRAQKKVKSSRDKKSHI